MPKESKHYRRVKDFMQKAKQATPSHPTVPSLEVRKLRARLILEEALETVTALGFAPSAGIDLVQNDDTINLVEVVDGCCDVMVVTTGTLIACGIPDVAVLRAVDENNLAKFAPGHSWDEYGKFIKPPGFKKVDLESVIFGISVPRVETPEDDEEEPEDKMDKTPVETKVKTDEPVETDEDLALKGREDADRIESEKIDGHDA
jgi:predicted HAD superfamily Cof-like phosphohydrolase